MFDIDKANNIKIIRGDSAEFDIKAYDKETHEEYVLQEGDSVIFTVKKGPKSANALIQKEGPFVEIEPEDTEDLSYGTYMYDVQLTYADGYKDTFIQNKEFKVLGEETW